jgi:peptide/nickel transport system permease protein
VATAFASGGPDDREPMRESRRLARPIRRGRFEAYVEVHVSTLHRVSRTARRTGLQAIPSVIAILALNFVLLNLAPGDAADVMAGQAGAATAETMAAIRERFGLDQPILQRLVAYLDNLAHFSLGYSPRFNMPVLSLIGERLPGTFLLMLTALGIAFVLGVFLGTVMAARPGGALDRILSIVSLCFYSIPGFWIGLMLIVVFSVKLNLLPSGGFETVGADLSGGAAVLDRLRHMILPATSLSLFFVAIYARLTRAAVLDAKVQDYVRTARAKGLSPFAITTRHVLRNALLPVTTMAGVHFGALLGGSVVVETVFSWPGLGRLAFESMMNRDFNVLLGILFLSSLLVIVINAAVDILHAWLDPRIEAYT